MSIIPWRNNPAPAPTASRPPLPGDDLESLLVQCAQHGEVWLTMNPGGLFPGYWHANLKMAAVGAKLEVKTTYHEHTTPRAAIRALLDRIEDTRRQLGASA